MAKGRVQIVRRKAGESRWAFVAHGAAFDREEAAKWIADYETGSLVRLLPIGKESSNG